MSTPEAYSAENGSGSESLGVADPSGPGPPVLPYIEHQHPAHLAGVSIGVEIVEAYAGMHITEVATRPYPPAIVTLAFIVRDPNRQMRDE